MQRLPIMRDDLSFRERSEQMFREMQQKMDQDLIFKGFPASGWPSMQGTGWGQPASRDEFFQLNPNLPATSSLPQRSEVLDDSTMKNLIVDNVDNKGKHFQMSFDVKNYDPSVLQVRVEDECLIVEARQADVKEGAKVAKEFCRRIQLPPNVDPEKLGSTLSNDGILTVTAPLPPAYNQLVPADQFAPQPLRNTSSTFGSSIESNFSRNLPMMGPLGNMPRMPSMGNPMAIGHPMGNTIFPDMPPSMAAPPASVDQLLCRDRPVFTQLDSNKRQMDLNLEIGRQFSPEDLVVKLDGRKLIIEAQSQRMDAFGKVSKASMHKEFELSEPIDPETISAMIREDGQLNITAVTIPRVNN